MDLGALRSTNMTMNDLAATAGLDWMELPLAQLSIMSIACVMFVAQIFPFYWAWYIRCGCGGKGSQCATCESYGLLDDGIEANFLSQGQVGKARLTLICTKQTRTDVNIPVVES
jgi:hypothetical protein